jgi:Protein of unknown function (DUF499)
MSDAYTLKPWSDVVEPHADVRSGELSMGTYAANLAAVASGAHRGAQVYADADQFFASTYFTQAMTSILRDVWAALAGKGGDRALQLRTPFGGGKTHSLLALYHLATSPEAARGVPELKDLPELGPVRVAVLSGEWLDPQRGREVDDRRIRTLWGELAYQLGGWDAFDELFEDGKEGTPLTGVNLTPLLDGDPTLILVDEALIYIAKGKSIQRGESNVGREALIFLQHLSEAVNQSRQAAMVYSLQASVTEAVEDEASLRALEQIAGRIDQRREPVTGDEVLRVVQRRLFESLGDEGVRTQVAEAYAEQHRAELEAIAETDSERREASGAAENLRERILLSYPFHPELIDLMNHRWGSLPTYQRTRGALQFLATVVHDLWTSEGRGKAGALIGPGDVDLRDERTRTAFFAQVGEEKQYRSVAEADFINPDAGTKRVDERLGRDSPALARLEIGTRVATAIMLMSFGAREGEERGVLEREILEATLVPELDGNLIRSALKELRGEALLYLHHTGRRYRFEPRPNLNKLVVSEQDKLGSEEVLEELRAALERKLASGGTGQEIVIWPEGPEQVKDEVERFRVIYLHPEWSEAKTPTDAFIGAGNRKYKNGLAIALPREASFDRARRATRQVMAIDRLISDKSRHGFEGGQIEELKERRDQAQNDRDGALREAYERVLLPRGLTGQSVDFDTVDLSTTLAVGRQLHDRVHEALENYVFESLQPSKLKALARLSERDAVPCEEIVAGVYTHFEMPRLWSPHAIATAVAKGVSDGLFGYCVDVDLDGDAPRVNDRSLIRFRQAVQAEEIDLGPGAALLSPEFAASLTETEEPEPPAEPEESEPEATVGGDGAPSVVWVTIKATEDDLHTINTALAGLRRITTPGQMRIKVEVEARSDEGEIDQIGFQNNVRQHLEDDEDVEFEESWARAVDSDSK